MNSSEDLRRHAIECGQMANFLRTKENRAEWNSIAERYLRFAKWCDARSSFPQPAGAVSATLKRLLARAKQNNLDVHVFGRFQGVGDCGHWRAPLIGFLPLLVHECLRADEAFAANIVAALTGAPSGRWGGADGLTERHAHR
jgi:hypothetical protein